MRREVLKARRFSAFALLWRYYAALIVRPTPQRAVLFTQSGSAASLSSATVCRHLACPPGMFGRLIARRMRPPAVL